MKLRKVLLAAIGSVLMLGAGVTLVSVLTTDANNTTPQAAQSLASDSAGTNNAAAVVRPSAKQANTSGGAKHSESDGQISGDQAAGYSDDSHDLSSGETEHDGEAGEND
jgi:hypothetical protein